LAEFSESHPSAFWQDLNDLHQEFLVDHESSQALEPNPGVWRGKIQTPMFSNNLQVSQVAPLQALDKVGHLLFLAGRI
jgi:hypothetical protein